jgi:preprotein translocase SecF subunit
VGAFSIIGHFFPTIEVDSLFITALLTILGYSVNDTIVVFDRIRENLRRTPGKSFEEIANNSLNQTLARSLNTSFTVLIILCALLVLGGDSIRNFILALTLGVAIGTYSSIFNASPLLVSWQGWVDKRSALAAKKS